MLIIAASALFFFHAATTTFTIACFIKIGARFLSHAIMHFHSNAGGNRHVKNGEYRKNEFFHGAKVSKKAEIAAIKANE